MDLFLSNRWLPLLATLGAAILSIYVGITHFKEIRGIQEGAILSPLSPENAESGKQPANHQANLAELARWHLFGEEKQETASTLPKPVIQRTEAPKTRLKLTLQGIFSPTVEGQEGWAIIEAPGENPKAYRIGDEVPGGALLTAVEVDQVIITRNNRPESLPLELLELSIPDEDYVHEMEPVEPMESIPKRPRTKARAREPSAAALSPELVEPASTTLEHDTLPAPYTESTEPVVRSPAIEAAEQDLVEEMKRLREQFKQQQEQE